jgi:hypothetical protein
MSENRQRTIIERADAVAARSMGEAGVHARSADRWENLNYYLGVPIVVLSAVASASALTDFDRSNVVAGVLALVVAVLSAVATRLNAQKASELHRTAAAKYETLDLRARSLVADLQLGEQGDEVLTGIRKLEEEQAKLIVESPPCSQRLRRTVLKRQQS